MSAGPVTQAVTRGITRGVTRLAPSPTGALHLGNAFAFTLNWVLARQQGWKVWLRIEDLDTPRVKAGADLQAISQLQWLGLDWDAGPVWQSHDLAPYRRALARLDIYPCTCTRHELASAPNEGDHELRYPGLCAGRGREGVPPPLDPALGRQAAQAWRLRVPPGPVAYADGRRGALSCDIAAQVGDFVLATKMNLPSYQLAVVVDDAAQGVTQVVRGCDLLDSTARQTLLYRLLGLPAPAFTHLPLVRGADGLRLAKRHGDTRLSAYQAGGVAPERVLGLIAFWAGWIPERRPCSLADLLARCTLETVPLDTIPFSAEDDRWLRAR